MLESVLEFFKNLPKELVVFLISILPLIELRGAIPVGALLFELPFYSNFILSVLGNLLPVPFILLFIPKILSFLARFKAFRPMVEWLRRKANKHSSRVLGKGRAEAAITASTPSFTDNPADNSAESVGQSENGSTPDSSPTMPKAVFIGLMLFVALPVPGTGAWTGALVAALFNIPKKLSLLAITLGVLVCGVIMCLASYGVLGFLSFLL